MNELDTHFLSECIEISRDSLTDPGLTPFGAIVVNDGVEVARGRSTVIATHDPTAHAELNALRSAGQALGTHLMSGMTMYCSGEPCPMCLVGCYWAGIGRIVSAGRLSDSESVGFQDRLFYDHLRRDATRGPVAISYGDNELRSSAKRVLVAWKRFRESLLP